MARAYGPVEKLRKTKQFITMRTIIEVAIGNITIFSAKYSRRLADKEIHKAVA